MARDRDVAAFSERAEGYEEGWLGRLHHEIADRTADLALAQVPAPQRVLDVGCGTGYLLRCIAARVPGAAELVGVDAAAQMVRVAQDATADPRARFLAGTAEHLPEPGDWFDLVVTTTSFDHWADQQAGLRECARVLAPGGRLVLVDQFSPLYLPTLIGSRRGKARTRRRATRLLTRAGFRSPHWHGLYAGIIGAVTASK
ncbi:MAG: class I SAM-dependent methyltransferase [Streptosporangiaceae bacterium]